MPITAFCFSIALAGLAGIPLLAGFTGKWMIFSASLAAGDLFSVICLGIFMVSTLIGLAGYLPILVKQYQPPTKAGIFLNPAERAPRVSRWMLAPVTLLAILVLFIGIFPAPWINLVEQVMGWMLI
jgi:NADH-quinone oxidoreductase subunit N